MSSKPRKSTTPRLVTLADEGPIIVSPLLSAFYLSQLILLREELSRRFRALSSLMNLRLDGQDGIRCCKPARLRADVEQLPEVVPLIACRCEAIFTSDSPLQLGHRLSEFKVMGPCVEYCRSLHFAVWRSVTGNPGTLCRKTYERRNRRSLHSLRFCPNEQMLFAHQG
jgi:hypothetical protein